MIRVAFHLPDDGLREITGMVSIEDEYLVLRVENKLLGLVDAEKDVIKIEPSALKEVYLQRGLFRDRLVLRPKKATLLDAMPGKHVSAVELRVWRKHRRDLERLVRAYDRLVAPMEG